MTKQIVSLSFALLLLGAIASFAPAVGAEGGVVQSATGAGQFVLDNGSLRTFAFTAVEHNDGSVSGEAEVINRDLGTRRHFSIDCLSIRNGNLAVVSGIVTEAEDPSLIGHPAIFAAQDNGQGSNANPDQVSQAVYIDQPFNCNTAPTRLALSVLVPISAGNVQVHDQ
jgi:hypothetical protein